MNRNTHVKINLKNIFSLILILFLCKTNAQSKPFYTSFFKSKQYKIEVQNLYKICKNSRIDGVHRLCLDFMRKSKLRKSQADFFDFCKLFKKQSIADNNILLYRRIELIELIQKLRYQPESDYQTEKKFEALYNTFLNDNDKSAALECLFELGQIYSFEKSLQSLKILFFAEKFAQKNNLEKDYSYQGVLHKIGYILWQLNKPELSTKYLIKGLKTNNSIPMDSLVSLNAIGINYQKMNQLKASNLYFDFASKVALNDQNLIFNVVIKGNQALTFFKLKQYDFAFKNANLDKNMCYQENLWENAVGALNLLVKIEIKRNKFSHAKTLLDSLNSVVVKIKPDDSFSLKRQKEANYLYYLAIKNYEKAFVCYKSFVQFDSIYQEYVSKNKISEMQINAAVKMYKEEMTKKEYDKKVNTILKIIFGVLFVLVMILLVRYLFKKIGLVEKEKTEITKINEAQVLEIEKLKIQLLNQLQLIKNENSNYQAIQLSQFTEDFNIELSNNNNENIEFLKNYDLSQKANWEEFKKLFNTIHPNFQVNIQTKISLISAAETRLLMLHKLGLKSKEIAETLLISPDSVKKAKYRLYKKIGINTVQELDSFIRNHLEDAS
jgi:DNA-binding CsgD family transcriptional regulator